MRTYGLKADTEITEESFYNRTYAMKEKRITGHLDGRAALEQAISKRLNTEKFEYPVYGFHYGIEIKRLVGKEQPYIRSELKRIFTAALSQDDRVINVSGFSFEFKGDTCMCHFDVESIYGTISTETGVTV